MSLKGDLDPFFVVKDEVFKALNKTRGLYLRWRELDGATGNVETEWITTELRNSLRSIEWDLEDLEDTIAIVEKNPNRFRIDSKELSNRRQFIDATRNEVKLMKEHLHPLRNRDCDITARQPLLESPKKLTSSPPSVIITQNSIGTNLINAAMASRHNAKYSKLENVMDSPSHYPPTIATNTTSYNLDNDSHNFLGETVSIQQRMMQHQDEQLDVISDSIGTLKTVSRQIGVEIDEQAVMLDEFGCEMDVTESKLDSTMRKVAKVMHISNDRRQWMAIGVLSLLLIIVILVFIIL